MSEAVKCGVCGSPATLFICNRHIEELRQMLTDCPWWLSRLMETVVGQARLGDPGRRGHRSGLERYADPKPVTNAEGFPDGTAGERRLEQDLKDSKLRARLLAQGGVNAHASELFDEVQNMLAGWCRDTCERRGLYWITDPTFIGPLRANEMRFAPRTAVAMARWLQGHASALASAECAKETFLDVKSAMERMERAVNKPPEPKTCGPCPTNGIHTDKGFVIQSDARSKCGTRLEARATATTVRCPVCKETHEIESLTARLIDEMQYMSFTIRELLDVVLPRANEHIPRRTLYDWVAKGKLKASGHDDSGTPKFVLADIRILRAQYVRKSA